ncbi:hypothetical protein [Streptomyces sp. CA-253872]|uniref:hypothetical protein n=1 Tax=Streptomyces sp. CA-253872 TaxID=3240067 RepID=UPI003D8DC506
MPVPHRPARPALTIDDQRITYDVAGTEFGADDAMCLPETPMSIAFGQGAHRPGGPDKGRTSTTPRACDVRIDRDPHVKGQVLAPPRQVNTQIAAYRTAGPASEDTVPNA